jgi:ribosomal protein S18 acetylase RimI-like enzyme
MTSTEAPVRPATEADGEELARLRWEFTLEDHDDPLIETWDEFRARFLARWHEFCRSGRWTVWVAESSDSPGQLIGCLWLETVDKVSRPIRHADQMGYITNVYVESASRNVGIGSRLMRAAIEQARERAFHSVFLWPSERSVEFYRRAGLEHPEDGLL